MPVVFFITHPDVAIDPSVPVPDWQLNARGLLELFKQLRSQGVTDLGTYFDAHPGLVQRCMEMLIVTTNSKGRHAARSSATTSRSTCPSSSVMAAALQTWNGVCCQSC